VALMGALGFLSSCGGLDGEVYVGMKPEFDLREYFDGPVKAWGFIQDRSGKVVTRFDADIVGSWDGDRGRLDEKFTYYDSGEVQERVWEITKLDGPLYEATAGDIIGKAQGHAFGNAIRWTYEMDVPYGGTTYRLKFEDWIWGMKDGVIINRSYMRKFGIVVAELTVFMQKQPNAEG